MAKVQIRTEVPGPRSKEVVAREQKHLAPGLQAFALWAGVAMDRGSGSYLTDVDGNTFVDLIGGIGLRLVHGPWPQWRGGLQS